MPKNQRQEAEAVPRTNRGACPADRAARTALGVAPGHHKGRQNDLAQALRRGGLFPNGLGFGAQQLQARPKQDQAAAAEDQLLQQGEAGHQCARPKEAGDAQRRIEAKQDQRREKGPFPVVSHSRLDHKKILRPDGRDIGQTHGQPLKIDRNKRSLLSVCCDQHSIPPPFAQERSFCRARKEKLTAYGKAQSLRLPLSGALPPP